jgi:hypothetical protein
MFLANVLLGKIVPAKELGKGMGMGIGGGLLINGKNNI